VEETLPIYRRRAMAGLAAAPFIGSAAHAQPAFPSRPMTLVIPFPAGGPSDVFGRHLAQGLAPRLGQSVVVENKSGAAGVTGVDFVAKAGSDAHVIGMMSASAGAIMQHLMPKMPFDAKKDIAPLTLMVRVQEILVVNGKLGINDFKGFVAAAKARPGKLTCGSAGTGGITHLAIELLKHEAGIDILHVPYRGSSQALGDLIGDHIDVLATNLPAALTAIQGKLVVPLAMTTRDRSPLVPEVPTLAEAGVDGIDVTSWYGMMAPHAIAPDVRDAIFAVTKEIMQTPALKAKMLEQGLNVQIEPPDVLAARIKRETALWADVIKSQHIVAQ
jgi:tripartite-type tricarboxylate transporter receptor subunit TctC